MSKPTKKPKSPKVRSTQVRRSLRALISDQQKWLAAGLPHRAPITATEVARRIAVMEEAVNLLEGKPA